MNPAALTGTGVVMNSLGSALLALDLGRTKPAKHPVSRDMEQLGNAYDKYVYITVHKLRFILVATSKENIKLNKKITESIKLKNYLSFNFKINLKCEITAFSLRSFY